MAEPLGVPVTTPAYTKAMAAVAGRYTHEDTYYASGRIEQGGAEIGVHEAAKVYEQYLRRIRMHLEDGQTDDALRVLIEALG